LEGKQQFDQGGLMLRVDDNHWIKTGIEVVDGNARASVVVTNRGWSDWSTQPWTKPAMAIRLIRIGESVVVEMKDDVILHPLHTLVMTHQVCL
jgi:regulation of enolase protein 1 (concanavalin A-like superfamily)